MWHMQLHLLLEPFTKTCVHLHVAHAGAPTILRVYKKMGAPAYATYECTYFLKNLQASLFTCFAIVFVLPR
jgi:hypothetical protein